MAGLLPSQKTGQEGGQERRRLVACQTLGWQTIPATVVDLDDPLGADLDENLLRKDFTPSELYAIGEKRRDLEEARAQQRRREGWKKRGQKEEEPCVDSTQDDAGKSRDAIADAVGLGWGTYQKIGGEISLNPP